MPWWILTRKSRQTCMSLWSKSKSPQNPGPTTFQEVSYRPQAIVSFKFYRVIRSKQRFFWLTLHYKNWESLSIWAYEYLLYFMKFNSWVTISRENVKTTEKDVEFHKKLLKSMTITKFSNFLLCPVFQLKILRMEYHLK